MRIGEEIVTILDKLFLFGTKCKIKVWYLSNHEFDFTFSCNLVNPILRTVQWGSEIRGGLDFEWSKRDWVVNGPDFKWDLKSRSLTI